MTVGVDRKPLLLDETLRPFRLAMSRDCLSALPHLAVPFRCGDVRVFSDDLFGWPREHTCSIVHQSHTRIRASDAALSRCLSPEAEAFLIPRCRTEVRPSHACSRYIRRVSHRHQL